MEIKKPPELNSGGNVEAFHVGGSYVTGIQLFYGGQT
jgi:hypothetical protein